VEERVKVTQKQFDRLPIHRIKATRHLQGEKWREDRVDFHAVKGDHRILIATVQRLSTFRNNPRGPDEWWVVQWMPTVTPINLLPVDVKKIINTAFEYQKTGRTIMNPCKIHESSHQIIKLLLRI